MGSFMGRVEIGEEGMGGDEGGSLARGCGFSCAWGGRVSPLLGRVAAWQGRNFGAAWAGESQTRGPGRGNGKKGGIMRDYLVRAIL